jgi:hypothetical protein
MPSVCSGWPRGIARENQVHAQNKLESAAEAESLNENPQTGKICRRAPILKQ